MKADKQDRRVRLYCPTCGSNQFSFDDEVEESPVICANCGRELTRDELIRENSENIQLHVSEIGDEIIKDAAKDINRALRDAFKGNKNIRFK